MNLDDNSFELLVEKLPVVAENEAPVQILSKNQTKKLIRREAKRADLKEKKEAKRRERLGQTLKADKPEGEIVNRDKGETGCGQIVNRDKGETGCGQIVNRDKGETGCGDVKRPPKTVRLREEFIARKEGSARILIDMDWESLMKDRDIESLCLQVCQSYGRLRQASKAGTKVTALSLTGMGPRVIRGMTKRSGLSSWPVGISDAQLQLVVKGRESDFVVLTGDAEDVLDVIEDDKIYVIGGLVDHNAHKNAVWDRANTLGLKTAKLPIAESGIELITSTILTVDQCAAIIQEVYALQESEDCPQEDVWPRALRLAIPMRKIISERKEETELSN